ncbi:very-long-chain (3R)-3-hydroxyacyl-CoA dehydratase [Malassezia cuniculi]|uniref:Very-long-chain (3R)-3-hydroxyacyl-CoA dehydratase n=1 Tax=Malassezia cuniculi TaxID=948313 RepID=A0AAF0EWH0_9BASI|nr:very-long-chain (3R)-3-hydroxyacyl-CoA dehydratase [Malassezia cuniculi]
MASGKQISGPVRFYLVAYNLLNFAGWLRIFIAVIIFMVRGQPSFKPLHSAIEGLLENFRPVIAAIAPPAFYNVSEPIATILRRATLMHGHIGSLVLVFQSLAILEVVHALIGWVAANPVIVAIQVFSRLAVLWAVVEKYTAAAHSPYYALLIFAWSFSEIARYPFYVNQLMDSPSYMALWGRYTWFIVLYPIGVLSEIKLILLTLPFNGQWPWVDSTGWTNRDWFFLCLIPLYVPGLFILYTRLLAQRSKVLGNDFVGSKAVEAMRKREQEFNARLRRPLGGSQLKKE